MCTYRHRLSLEVSVRRLVVASFTDEKTEIQRGNLSKFTLRCWDPNPEPDCLTTTLSVMPSTNERSANPSCLYHPATVLRTESKVQAKRIQAKHGRGRAPSCPQESNEGHCGPVTDGKIGGLC